MDSTLILDVQATESYERIFYIKRRAPGLIMVDGLIIQHTDHEVLTFTSPETISMSHSFEFIETGPL